MTGKIMRDLNGAHDDLQRAMGRLKVFSLGKNKQAMLRDIERIQKLCGKIILDSDTLKKELEKDDG